MNVCLSSNKLSFRVTSKVLPPPLQVFAIFAFATAGGYCGSTHFSRTCGAEAKNININFCYPFRYYESKWNKKYFPILQ